MKKFSIGCLGLVIVLFALGSVPGIGDLAIAYLASLIVIGGLAIIPWFCFRKLLGEKGGYWFWGAVALLSLPLAISIKDTPHNSTDDTADASGDGQAIVDTTRGAGAAASAKPAKTVNGIPDLVGPLCDYAGIFSAEEARKLEARLRSFETGDEPAQFVVLTIDKLPANTSEEEFCLDVGTAWELGDKDKDNGLLFLFSLKDRACRLETGYGLEGTLPDSVCGAICRSAVPDFKVENYAAGILRIVDEVDKRLNRERYIAEAREKHAGLFDGYPAYDGYWDPSGYFNEKQATRLRELLHQEHANTDHPLYFICVDDLYGIDIADVCQPAWEKLHRINPKAVLLCVSPKKNAQVWKHFFAPDDYAYPSKFDYTVKYMCDTAVQNDHYNSVGRAILDFEEKLTGHRPEGWWEFNLAFGIMTILGWIFGAGIAGFICLVIWAVIDEIRHPSKSSYSGPSYHSSSYSSSSSSYSSHSSSHSSYSGRGGSFGGGGGGARW